MYSLMMHGDYGGKRPTVTKHKMNVCARNFKAIFGAIFSKSVKWFEMEKSLLLGVNAKWGLLVILVNLAKFAPRPSYRVLCKKLKKYFPKFYIGQGPISTHSTPRVNTEPTANTQARAAPTPNPKAQASGSLFDITYVMVG
jgi:hypothetical protein